MKKITIVLMSFLSFYIQAGEQPFELSVNIEHRVARVFDLPGDFEDYDKKISPSGTVIALHNPANKKLVFFFPYQNQRRDYHQSVSSFNWVPKESNLRPYKLITYIYKQTISRNTYTTLHYLYREFPDVFRIEGDENQEFFINTELEIQERVARNIEKIEKIEPDGDLVRKTGNPKYILYNARGTLNDLKGAPECSRSKDFGHNRWFIFSRNPNEPWVEINEDSDFERDAHSGNNRMLRPGIVPLQFLKRHSDLIGLETKYERIPAKFFPNQYSVTQCISPLLISLSDDRKKVDFKAENNVTNFVSEEPIASMAFVPYKDRDSHGNEAIVIYYWAIIGNNFFSSSQAMPLPLNRGKGWENYLRWFEVSDKSTLFPKDEYTKPVNVEVVRAPAAHIPQRNRGPAEQPNVVLGPNPPNKPQQSLAWRFMQSLRASIFKHKMALGLSAASAFYVYRYGFTAQPLRSLFSRGPIQLYSWRR